MLDTAFVRRFGPRLHSSPLLGLSLGVDAIPFVSDDDGILFDDRPGARTGTVALAGPRAELFFEPRTTRIGIVTCGGLCPGLNDVIRGLVMVAWHRYGVRELIGFRYGFRGIALADPGLRMDLSPDRVRDIHEDGGTILGSSRGPQSVERMVDRLAELEIGVLFVVGGDGSMRGALALVEEIERRGLEIAVVGVPKTIDNDLLHLDRSFGFETAYSEAVAAIEGAHREAWGAPHGVGVVKLMGRHSGFIACLATLATSHVNVCLVPEIPFQLEGRLGLFATLERRLRDRGHAVVVVAEGAGQRLLGSHDERDVSGNRKLRDIGPFLVGAIKEHFAGLGEEVNLKYIDPSYIIRSVPASPPDRVLCWRLAQNAVHAAMAGWTGIVVGERHRRLVHLPMAAIVAGRRQVEPGGDLWLSVLENTGQPPRME